MRETEIRYETIPEDLFRIPLPVKTATYSPVPHLQLADVTLEAITKAGFKLGKQTLTSARNGKIANGRYTIENVADSEMKLEIGWQNSYDKTLSLKFALGTRIIVCDNGVVNGDLGAFKRKHTGDVGEFAPLKIIEEIKGAGEVFRKIQEQRIKLKNVRINRKIAASFIGMMFVENLISSDQINIIKRELLNPTFDYGEYDSLWTLYQHTTFAMRQIHPQLYLSDHKKVHNFFLERGSIALGSSRGLFTPPVSVHSPGIAYDMEAAEEGWRRSEPEPESDRTESVHVDMES